MNRRWVQSIWILALFFLGFLAYLPALSADYLSDDFHFLFDIQRHGFSAVWSVFSRDFFRPLVTFSFWLDEKLWGYRPWGYHWTNLFLHVINSWLVSLFAGLWMKENGWTLERTQWLAPLAGTIFLVHPSHTEAVSWISGRSDVLAACGALASLTAYFRYRLAKQWRWLFASWLLFGTALLAKESVITYPLMILLFETGNASSPPDRRRRWLPAAGYLATIVVYLGLRRLALGEWLGGYDSTVRPQLEDPLWFRNLVFYTTRSLIPAVDWSINPYVMPTGKIAFGLLAIALLWTGIRWEVRRCRQGRFPHRWELPGWALVLGALYLISLLPVLDTMNLSVHLRAFFGERLIYWPSVFTVLFLTAVADAVFQRWRWAVPAILAVVAMFYTASLYRANTVWSEAGELSRRLVQDIRSLPPGGRLFILNAPDSWRGAYLFRNGLPAVVRLEEGGPRWKETHVLAFQNLHSPQDGARCTKLDSFALELVSIGDKAYFIRPSPSSSLFEFLRFGRQGYRVRFSSIQPGDKILLYTAGRFESVFE